MLVGDRIAAIGDVNLIGFSRADVSEALRHFTSSSGGAEQETREYFGSTPVLTLASPVFSRDEDDVNLDVDVIGYRLSKLRLPTASSQSSSNVYDTVNDLNMNNDNDLRLSTSGGDSICNWQLLTPSNSIFHDSSSSYSSSSTSIIKEGKVGYIRLTRFLLSNEGSDVVLQDLKNQIRSYGVVTVGIRPVITPAMFAQT